MNDLRIGVIGFGSRHTVALHAHQPGEGSAITVVADHSARGKANAREALGEDIPTVDSVEQLLADWDASLARFVEIMPVNYRLVLEARAAAEAEGLSDEETTARMMEVAARG